MCRWRDDRGRDVDVADAPLLLRRRLLPRCWVGGASPSRDRRRPLAWPGGAGAGSVVAAAGVVGPLTGVSTRRSNEVSLNRREVDTEDTPERAELMLR